ncbi:hypothetical protein COM86_25425 [Priestia megaterium]|jgi:hypothetical protein|nr:hypothetical protein COM86_25425 [Priestia megaterium]PEE75586.1 hypothetical protein COM81_17305 [Priestia megaterium]PFI89994.1 hypothetical protein COI84_23030 [Priestia megaterium]PGR05457.1 hypothetical protein COC62_28630 [Priestia megaterium]
MALSSNLKLVLLNLLIIIGFSSYFLYSSNNYKIISKKEINDFIEDKKNLTYLFLKGRMLNLSEILMFLFYIKITLNWALTYLQKVDKELKNTREWKCR